MEGRAVWRALSCAVAAVAIALLLPAQAFAKAAPAPILESQARAYQAMTELERIKLLIALCNSGQHELANSLLERYPLVGPYAVNRKLFIDGMILKGRRDYKGAVKKFRAALANDPKLTLVRAELAKTLVILEEDDSARHHLEQLMAAAPDQQQAQSVKSFIDTIDARRPYRVNAFVSVAPSTNITNGTYNDTIYVNGIPFKVSGLSEETSGFGFVAGINGAYSRRLDNNLSAIVAGGITGRKYDDGDFDSLTTSQSVEFRYLADTGYIGFGAVGSQSFGHHFNVNEFEDFDLNSYAVGPRVSMFKQLGPKDQINATSVFEWRNYPQDNSNDGTASLNSIAWTHAFDESLALTLGVGVDRIVAENDLASYWTRSVNVEIYKELPAGITATLRGEARFSEFDARHPMFGNTREDTRYIGTVRLTKRDFDIWGYAPVVEYTYSRNDSNQELYQFDSHALDFRLTKDF
jgi:tetratricopeptide (TPR) repeat protein